MIVRLSNLMKVLTSDAIQDPTRVEAKVRREVAMRKHNHEKVCSFSIYYGKGADR